MADQHAASLAFLAEFWEGQDISPEAIAAHRKPNGRTWLEEVQEYVDGFEARDLSDAELRRCTEGSDLLFHLAVLFREAGMLSRPLSPAPESASHAEMHLPVDPGVFTLQADQPYDELFSMWIDLAPRFGAVAAHFPRSLRCRRFVASFWAPEIFMPHPFGDPPDQVNWYLAGGIREFLDGVVALTIERRGQSSCFWAPEVLLFGDLYFSGWTRSMLDAHMAGHLLVTGRACPVTVGRLPNCFAAALIVPDRASGAQSCRR